MKIKQKNAQVYPDSQHTPDEETQKHLYKRMTNFLANCFHINYHEAEPPTPEELAAAKKSSDDWLCDGVASCYLV